MARRLCILFLILALSSCSAAPEAGSLVAGSASSAADSVQLPDQWEQSSPNASREPEQQETSSSADGQSQSPVSPEPDGDQLTGETGPSEEPPAQEPESPPVQQGTSSSAGSTSPEAPNSEPSISAPSPEPTQPEQEVSALKITVGDYELLATFEDNPSARAFQELLAQGPLTVSMEDYGGFEKVGPLGTTLTRSDTSITTQPGDVILYQGNQITIYYGTNSWTFTRLAKIDDPTDLQAKLGEGTVQVTFSLA